MLARVLLFPTNAEHHRTAALQLAPVVTARWMDNHLAIIATAIELLELDDQEFAVRAANMQDREGVALLSDLCDALAETSGELETIYRGLYMAKTRLSATAPLKGADL